MYLFPLSVGNLPKNVDGSGYGRAVSIADDNVFTVNGDGRTKLLSKTRND